MIKSTLFAAAAFALACSTASATTVITADQAVGGEAGASGLLGTYWHVPAGATGYNLADTLAARNANAASGTFVSSNVAYYGGDGTSITDFLGSDGASYVGTVSDLSDGILEFKGYIQITAPGTVYFAFNHDDAAQLTVGNQVLLSQNCCGFQVEDAVFSTAGMYAINLVYANTYYYGWGGAVLEMSADGQNVGGMFQSVPEPGSMSLMLVGALGLLAGARRRKSNQG
ncbi:MAG: PEP-CTERM sorting domain-containing protein [Pseudomonadota bacterium]